MRNVFVTEAGKGPKDAYVGPYWFVRDCSRNVALKAHRCAFANAEQYGDFLTCPHGHCEIWEGGRTGGPGDRIADVLSQSEYEEWPRGRVVFHSVRGQFIVYGDAQIFAHELQDRVLEHFGIPAEGAVFMRDDHYRSTRSLHPADER